MKHVGAWWAPLLLLFAPIALRVPAPRDVLDYFVPMRLVTADAIRTGHIPWLNMLNGCGEPWFANPQTGIAYPPHWSYVILPLEWAVTLEVVLHLVLLSYGVGRLARRLGAGPIGTVVAEVAAWSTGPVLTLIGVINNLGTLAWVPWMVLAASSRHRWAVGLTACVTALAWLAGEPQVWALGVVVSMLVAPRRRMALVGLGLGLLLVSWQVIPFVHWVLEGDRGLASAEVALRGAVTPGGWLAVLAPGLPTAGDGIINYASSLFLGAPLLTFAVLGIARYRTAIAGVACCALLATLPAIGGTSVYLVLTRALVRYPSRFALVALVGLLPFVARGAELWLKGRGRWTAAVCGSLGVVSAVVATTPIDRTLALTPAVVLLVAMLMPQLKSLRWAAVGIGLAAVIGAGIFRLELLPTVRLTAIEPFWPEVRGDDRVYSPPPHRDAVPWLAGRMVSKHLWPVGYVNLADGFATVRTYSPLAHRRLAEHILGIDDGPHRRWWLDTAAAPWVILPVSPEGTDLPVRRRRGRLWLYRNPTALPLASVAVEPPRVGVPWQGVGAYIGVTPRAGSMLVTIKARGPGWCWLSVAPARGWRWRLDGRVVTPSAGPGILQSVPVTTGVHRLEGTYRPPGLQVGVWLAAITALGILAGGLSRRRATTGLGGS